MQFCYEDSDHSLKYKGIPEPPRWHYVSFSFTRPFHANTIYSDPVWSHLYVVAQVRNQVLINRS